MRQACQKWDVPRLILTLRWRKSVAWVPDHSGQLFAQWQIGSYRRRFDAYMRPEIGVSQDFWRKIYPLLCSTFRGRVMSQNGVQAKLCVRKTVIDSSVQAQRPGDFMRQKWRSYGIFDNYLWDWESAALAKYSQPFGQFTNTHVVSPGKRQRHKLRACGGKGHRAAKIVSRKMKPRRSLR
jgi:hypothetical protein